MEEGGDDGKEASIGGSSSEDFQEKEVELDAFPLHPSRKWSTLLLHASIMGGREFLYAVEIVLVTPIILQLGMPERYYSFMWCFSPIIGVLVGPLLGSSSDHCKSRFGRRRPYIVGLVVGAVIGLTFLIFSKDIALFLGGSNAEDKRVWGIVVGIVGAQLMDFCLDQTETPLRAYTLDVCSSKDQQRAFALQTVFIGIGGALGFIVDGIDWEHTVISSIIDSQIEVVYLFAVFAYLISTIFNLTSIKLQFIFELIKRDTLSRPHISIVTRSILSLLCFLIDGSTQTTIEDLKNGNLPSQLQNGNPSILVSIYEDNNSDAENEQDPLSIPSRAVCSLPHVSLSKGLYISTSCPGGLEENNAYSSFPTHSNDDSVFEEDSNLKSRELSEEVVTAVSLPSLEKKKNGNVTSGRNFLNFIRTKEFSIRNIRTSNRIEDSEWKSTEKLTNSEKCIDDFLIENSIEHSDRRTDALMPLKHSPKSVSDPIIKALPINPAVDSISNGQANGILLPVKSSKKKKKQVPVSLKQLWLSIVTMPTQLKWLCLAQLLGFIGYETVMLWYTDLMGRVVYQGDPQGASNSTSLANYNAGVKMGCWGLAIYSAAMIMFSVFKSSFHLFATHGGGVKLSLQSGMSSSEAVNAGFDCLWFDPPDIKSNSTVSVADTDIRFTGKIFMERMRILKRFSIRILYSFSFLLMAFAMLIMFLYTDRYVILLLSWTIGVTVAVLLTVPYVLVGKYHLNAKYVMKSPGNTKRGFGLDCGILACQMYAGNVISASISSPVIYMAGSVKAMLLLTGACNLVAFFFAYLFVTYPGEGKSRCQSKDMVERSTETR